MTNGCAKTPLALLLGATWLLIACNSKPATNGQTGSPMAEPDLCFSGSCCKPTECRLRAEWEVSKIMQPPVTQALVEAYCYEDGFERDGKLAYGNTCFCGFTSSEYDVGPVESGKDCYVPGFRGGCVLDASGFSGCSPDDSESCAALCGELEHRLAEDRAGPPRDAHYVHSECGDEGDYCYRVLSIDSMCHAYGRGRDIAYDCALGGEEILERYREDVQHVND